MQSSTAVPLHFTVEFIGFLVLAGGALLVPTRPALIPGPRQNRWTVGAGFLVLAAAQAAHGGGFVESDGGTAVVALTTVGLALVLVGVVGVIGSTYVAATVPFQIREPMLLAPAGAAFILAFITALASVREAPKAFRRLSVAAAALGVAEVLISVSPAARFESGRFDAYLYAGHGFKLLAFLGFTSWLHEGIRSSIRTRFVASFVGLLIVVVLALSSALTGVISNNIENEELRRVSILLENAKDTLADDGALIGREAARLRSVNQRLAARDVSLRQLVEEFSTDLPEEVDFLMFSARGHLAAKGHGPGRQTARGVPVVTKLTPRLIRNIQSTRVVGDVAGPSSEAGRGIQRVGSWRLAIIAAYDIADPKGGDRSLGLIVAGEWIDAFAVEKLSNTVKPAKASVVIDDRVVASDLEEPVKGEVLVPPDVRADVEEGLKLTRRQTFGQTRYFSAMAPLSESPVDPVATLVVSQSAESVVATQASVTRILFLVAMLVGAVALALAYLSGRRITKPIQQLTRAATSVREGDLGAKAPVTGADEVGQLGATFNEMTDSLGRMTSDLRRAASEEHDLRFRIETIIQSMADGLIAVDAEHNVLAWNRETEALTGISARRAVGKRVDRLLDPRNGKDEPISLPLYDLEEGSVSGVFLARKSGDPIPVAVTSAVLRDEEGEISGAVAVLRDMTREREVERMKSEFLSNISHELRTPLTPIKGYAEILGRKDIPKEKAQQFVRGILESTVRLERIVELLVDFSALEAGRLTPRSAPVDVKAVVERITADLESKTPHHNVVAEVKSRLPKVVGDERLLRRSLEEIVDNAVKFSPHGGTIRVEAKSAVMGNGQGRQKAVAISISDEGIGISKEDLARIFSDFQQLDGSETRAFGGLGLGLAFVQRIVDAHDGAVSVASKPDEGTRFTITIPAVSTASGGAKAEGTAPSR